VHGDKFKLNDATTWQNPHQQSEVVDAKQGRLRLRCWHQMHFRTAAQHPLHLILVERLDEHGNRRTGNPVWLIWVGESMPPLDQIWQIYCRRFGVDHWFRFAKQRLHWTLPNLSTAKQAERWSDLMPLLSWQLWLARDLVAERPLPWQKNQTHLTPARLYPLSSIAKQVRPSVEEVTGNFNRVWFHSRHLRSPYLPKLLSHQR
jgi:hypothetical protein